MTAATGSGGQYGQGYYTQGTAALARVEQRAEERERHFAAGPVAKPSPVTRVRRVMLARVLVLAVVLFASSFAVLQVQARIQQNNIALAALKSELGALEKEADRLELDIVMAEDLDEARRVATQELGMVAPGPGQIRYVQLPADTQLASGN